MAHPTVGCKHAGISDRLPASGPDLWRPVDNYLMGALLPPDLTLTGALERSTAPCLPEIAVAPNQGKLLQLIARMIGARRILVVGTLGGYSPIWLARTLPTDGRLTTLEVDPKHAQVARGNVDQRPGRGDLTDVHVST